MSASLIHPTAIIDEDVQIGATTKIWHFCHISRGARLGERSSLGQNVYVGDDVVIGCRVKVQNNVSIYSGVEIADDVFIGPSVVFTNVKRPRAHINQRSSFSTTRIAKGATLGANATIVCGTNVGEFAFVAAGSVVTKDVPPFAQVQGNPAVQVGWVDEDGRPTLGPPEASQGKDRDTAHRNLPPPTQENETLLDELESAAQRVLRSGHFIQGPEVEHFEREVSEFLGAKHAISCSNASDALVMALVAGGIRPGDEVITTPFSFFATAECIVRAGAIPIFVDIDPESLHLDVDLVLGALTERTRAVVAVHLFGQSQDLTELRSALRDRNVLLVEDAAQAFGAASDEGSRLGATSHLCCFSFFPSKNLGGFGDGGLITTTSDETARTLRSLRRHGASAPHHHEHIGGNYRMDALQAALLRAKLPYVPELLRRRKQLAGIFLERLGPLQEQHLRLPKIAGCDHTYNQFVIRTSRRDALQAHLKTRGIDCPIYYPTPLHRQPALLRYARDVRLPRAEQAAKEVLALPVHPALRAEDVEHVASAVLEFLAR